MQYRDSVPPSSVGISVTPVLCPTCASPAIVTTAKIPDADSYWRCTSCGDVWNASRSQNNRYNEGRRRY